VIGLRRRKPAAGRLNHVRRGEGDPLLLLHSLGGSLVQWSPVLDLLADAGREVLAVDMPGFGDSPSLPDGIEPSAANLAAATLDFYDSLGLDRDPDVAGISLGGWVSIECARARRARSVVGICTAGFWRRAPTGSTDALNRARAAGRATRHLLPAVMATAAGRRQALGRFMAHPERMRPEEAVAMARAYVTAPGYPEANALMRGGAIGEIKDVKVPVTLAWAEHDRIVRRPKPEIFPRKVRQVELPGCGHVPTWDAPELIARVILEGTGG
jgi:pimeloyl-ACP methyl ester carboxylesterase